MNNMSPEQSTIQESECTFPREIYLRVKRYSNGIEEEDEYKTLVEGFEAEEKASYESFLSRGISSSTEALKELFRASCSKTRGWYLRQLDNEEIPDPWFEDIILGREASRNGNIHQDTRNLSDQEVWLSKLEQVREKDMNNVLKKLNKIVDPYQETSYRRHAEIIGIGHDLIISKFKEELGIRTSEKVLFLNGNA